MTTMHLFGTRRLVAPIGVALGILLMTPTNSARAQAAAPPAGAAIQRALNAAYEKYKDLREGKNADYIPALAKVDPNLYGLALVTPDGRIYTAGDTTTKVSIQSISKVFTLARVLQDSGERVIVKNTG